MTREASNWEAKVGKHEFYGELAPPGVCGSNAGISFGSLASQSTFSVGVFQWVLKANGKGVKRGPVKVRISGNVGDAKLVAAKARAICELLDLGAYTGPKNVKVK